MSKISWENYEEYMMMHADGELQEAEERELMDFVAQHPQLQSELEEYSSLRLVPDTTMVYANKQALIKEEVAVAPRIISFPAWRKYSIAAAAAIVLFVSAYKVMNGSNDINNNVVAANSNKQSMPVKEDVAVPVNDIAVPTEIPVNAAVAHNSNTAQVQHEQVTTVRREQQAVRQDVQVAHQDTKPPVPANEMAPAPQAREIVAPVAQLPVAGVKEVTAPPTTTTAAETVDVPAYAAVQEQVEEKKTFLDKLPVDDIKKKQIGNIAGAIKDATENKWSIKIEKKKLVLSF